MHKVRLFCGVLGLGFSVACGSVNASETVVAKLFSNTLRSNPFFGAAEKILQERTLETLNGRALITVSNSGAVTGGKSWAGALRFLGKRSMPGVAVSLAIPAAIGLGEKAVEWYFGDEPGNELSSDQVMIDGPNTMTPDKTDPYAPHVLAGLLTKNHPAYECGGQFGFNVLGMNPHSVAQACLDVFDAGPVSSPMVCTKTTFLGNPSLSCQASFTDPEGGPWGVGQVGFPVQLSLSSSQSCAVAEMFVEHECVPDPMAVEPVKKAVTIEEAIKVIPEETLDKYVNPQLMADMFNLIWLDAVNQADYDGVPIPSLNPFTADEVWLRMVQMGLDNTPKVRDFTEGRTVTNPGNWAMPTAAVPNPQPDASPTNPNPDPDPPVVPPVPPVDLGPNPGTPQPQLEQTPTAKMIIDPLQSLFPDLKNYQASIPDGECPRPSFDVFGQSFVIESHCVIFEDNRAAIELSMMAAFSILSLLIVLRA